MEYFFGRFALNEILRVKLDGLPIKHYNNSSLAGNSNNLQL